MASGGRRSRYPKLNIDTPVATLDDFIVSTGRSLTGARVALVFLTLVLTILFVQAAQLVRRSWLAAFLTLVVCLALPSETVYAFVRLFRPNGATAGRPLTVDQGIVYDWVDRTLETTRADVTMVPYALDAADYYSGVGFWWDLEFWNATVDRAAYLPGEFLWTPSTFPKLLLHFNPRTGLANISPTRYVTIADKETRFRISGRALTDTRDVLLIDASMPWRADWLTSGLYDDGWTKPHVTARIRIFSEPAQTGPVIRYLTLGISAPTGVAKRPIHVVSNKTDIHADANGNDRVVEELNVCVPAHGFSDVRLTAAGTTVIYGDLRNATTAATSRRAGVILTEIAVADEIGPPCSL